MSSSKMSQEWAEEKNQLLNSISEAASKANAVATGQLRDLAYQLLKSKIAPTQTGPIYHDDPAIVFFFELWREHARESRVRKMIRDRLEGKAETSIENLPPVAEAIRTFISLLRPKEIYRLIKDIMDHKPSSEILSNLQTKLEETPIIRPVGTINVPEGEQVKYFCPHCLAPVITGFSRSNRTLNCGSCGSDFESHKVALTLMRTPKSSEERP